MHRLVIALLLLCPPLLGEAREDALCDVAGVCLREAEAERFERARTALDAGDRQTAIAVLERLRESRRASEGEASLLVAGDLATALTEDGRRIEAALVLEDYLRGREDLGEAFRNLLVLYDELSGASLEDGAVRPGPRRETVERRQASIVDTRPDDETKGQASDASRSEARSAVEESAIRAALEQWRDAWAAGNVEAYLELYAADAAPREGMTRASWERQRRARIRPDRDISIDLQEISLAFPNADGAVTRFAQRYRASDFSDRVRKELHWVNTDGGWRIREERVIEP